MTFRPEQIKEKCSSKDGSDGNTNKDVIRSDANIVIVVFGGQVVLFLDKRLLVDVICISGDISIAVRVTKYREV